MLETLEKQTPNNFKNGGIWIVPENLDISNFDFDWRPDKHDPPYIHQFGTQWQKTGGPRYIVSGATAIKYRDEQRAIKLSDKSKFTILINENLIFDWSWHPDDTEPPYIYVFDNQWLSGHELATVEYHVSGASQRKYMASPLAKIIGNKDFWHINMEIDQTNFDLEWHPPPYDSPYIYVWGNKWISGEVSSTVEYAVPSATQKKYMPDLAPLKPHPEKYNIIIPIDTSSFDFTWYPPSSDPPYIYVWGNQWNNAVDEPTVIYTVPGATQYKYMDDQRARVIKPEDGSSNYWQINLKIDEKSFDFSWRPSPAEPPYIYMWGNQWNSAVDEPTVIYTAPGATQYKYMSNQIAIVLPTTENWSRGDRDYGDFDFSWRPNPASPPQIYQWEDGGPTYIVPGATDVVLVKNTANAPKEIPQYYIYTTLADLVLEHKDEVFWALNPDLTYTGFDFNWKPDNENFRHINVFGNNLSKDLQTYYVNGPTYVLGYRELNYIEDTTVTVDSNLSMFWIDTGYGNYGQYDELKIKYTQLQKTRFAGSWVDTITRCINKSSTKLLWILSSDIDYSNFKFDFYPSSWQMHMLHVFGTQWGIWGNTYLVNSQAFLEKTKYVKVIEHLVDINHVRAKKTTVTGCIYDVLYIDFGNTTENLDHFKKLGRTVYTAEYKVSYLNTMMSWLKANPGLANKKDYCVWITASVCDYGNFDFSYRVDPFQRTQLHVFSSIYRGVRQKFGDTFLLNVAEFMEHAEGLSNLADYHNKVNFIEHLSARRQQHPVIEHHHDSQVDAIKEPLEHVFPYAEYINAENAISTIIPPVNLWVERRTPVEIGTYGATQIIVPKIAVEQIKDEIYDYPHISTIDRPGSSRPLDIIFISNGESVADRNYKHLCSVAESLKLSNRIVRIKDVNGRVASQHAAASASSTNWYFLVNGKIDVGTKFDWGWQPDRLQVAKHYIFNILNPVNGLFYGHQAIVANNKKLTLATVVKGLDFTMDSPHEVIDMDCGVALYNTDPWTTWRTAFREAIKLRNNPDPVSKYRLKIWLSTGNGDNGIWSKRGASDGVEYWEKVDGDMQQLMKSYDWGWIKEYYNSKYK